MTQPAVLRAWYGVTVPPWAPVMLGVALLLVLVAFAIDAWRAWRARQAWPVTLGMVVRDSLRFAWCAALMFKRNPWTSVRVWFPRLVPILQRCRLWPRVWLCRADDETDGVWIYR